MPEALTSLVGGNEPACRRALLAALVFVLTVNAAVLSYLVIMLPTLGRSLGLPDIHVASILGLAALLAIVAAPGWGVVVERLGRRPVLLMATAAVTLGSVAFGIAINLGLKGTLSGERLLAVLMVIRAAQAIMAAGMIPASQALIADVTDNHDRTQTMGLIGAAYGMGGIIGGIMMWAFIPSQAGWVFIGFGAAACISFLCVIMWVGRLRKRARRRMEGRLRLRGLLPLVTFTFLVICAYAVLKQVATFRLHDVMGYPLEVASSRAGAAMTATAAAMIGVQLFLLQLLKLSAETIMGLGALLGAAGMGLCAFAPGFVGLFAGAVTFGVALGLMLPGNLASLSFRVADDQQGKVAGLNVMGQGLGLTLGPLLGAMLNGVSPHLPLVVGFGLMLLAACLARIIWQRRPRHDIARREKPGWA
ncbi:MFS transporter [Paracoccus sp. (in: a-proteobacteria)]|uniref:MFS transporter n=1 Tax=Paracoccus sp. TaxID=267 RepID=UPI0028B141F3|nr:MFS transporter [Paracoccus sp. (in: a-proteobacteria)]